MSLSDSTTFCPGLPHVKEPAKAEFRVGNKIDDRMTDDENDREIQSFRLEEPQPREGIMRNTTNSRLSYTGSSCQLRDSSEENLRRSSQEWIKK